MFSMNPLNDTEFDIDAIQKRLYEIPYVLREKTSALDKLGDKVSLAQLSAAKALKDSKDLKGYVDKKILGINYASGDTKTIISDTQKLVKDIAMAVSDQADAQQLSFEFHKELADTSEYLFILSCGNIATNEAMIHYLQDAIKELGNKKSIGDPQVISFKHKVQEQYRNVVERLYSQREILVSIEKHKEDIKLLKKEKLMLEQNLSDAMQSIATTKQLLLQQEKVIRVMKTSQYKINCVFLVVVVICCLLALVVLLS